MKIDSKVQKILDILKSNIIPFDEMEKDLAQGVCEEYISYRLAETLPPDIKIQVKSGVTKLCIIIEGANQVIKIPFLGWYDEEQYDQDLAAYTEDEENFDKEPQWEDYYYPFEGAADFAKADSIVADAWDYCGIESFLYDEAAIAGLSDFFAEEKWVLDIGNTPVYIQERCEALHFEKTYDYTKQEARATATRKRCSELGCYCFEPKWIDDFIAAYGEDTFKSLSIFLKTYDIEDLRPGNIGYTLSGAPVLLDYASYRG